MSVPSSSVRFFMGANTPGGFRSFSEDLYDPSDGWRAYLIKSGAGTGKSSLMRRIADELSALGQIPEFYACSSDPSSLDAVRFPGLKLCLADATAPHVMEPSFWGATEQLIPLAVCMDENRLHEQYREVQSITLHNRELHDRCRKYIGAAAELMAESCRLEREALDTDKVHHYAVRLAARELSSCETGKVEHRFLSAVTPEGIITFYDTLQTLCPRIYTLHDEYGAAAEVLMTALEKQAQERGIACLSCPSFLETTGTPEHLLFPSAGVAFTVSNLLHTADFPAYRHIHASRFLDTEALRRSKQRLSFNRRAIRELLDGAVELSAEAKAVHDRMEILNGEAMNWEALSHMADNTTALFRRLAEETTVDND